MKVVKINFLENNNKELLFVFETEDGELHRSQGGETYIKNNCFDVGDVASVLNTEDFDKYDAKGNFIDYHYYVKNNKLERTQIIRNAFEILDEFFERATDRLLFRSEQYEFIENYNYDDLKKCKILRTIKR